MKCYSILPIRNNQNNQFDEGKTFMLFADSVSVTSYCQELTCKYLGRLASRTHVFEIVDDRKCIRTEIKLDYQ